MSKNTKEELEYEERLRNRIDLLKEHLEEGKIHLPENSDVIQSLEAVKISPNGEVDLSTVDGIVRSLALSIEVVDYRQKLKDSASLSEIQNAYFNNLSINFSKYYEAMIENGITPHDVGMTASKNPNTVKFIKGFMPELLEWVDEFWSNAGEIAHIHVEDMRDNLKGVYGGDLFPTHNENIASKCGIYTDTIILPDPFLRTKNVFKISDDATQAYYIMKHAMNLLQYKDLACAEIGIPIVVVLPDKSILEEAEQKFFHELGEEDSLIHNSKLFNRNFKSVEELYDFCEPLNTIDKVLKEVKDTSRLVFDSNWNGDKSSQFKKFMQSKEIKMSKIVHPAYAIATIAIGRMASANELLFKARDLGGSPIIDAPTSWEYFNMKLENDAGKAELATGLKGLHITKGLQDLGKGEMPWLGNIPPESLIQIRKDGAMDEIRDILSTDIERLIDINPSNFHRTHDQIFENIHEAFAKHQENINKLRDKKWKFAGQDIGSWLVTGSMEIATVLTGSPIIGLATFAADQMFDLPKLKNIPESFKKLKEENDKIQRSPVGMLFNIKNKLS